MKKLTGSYVWHYVSDENKITGVEEDRQYLVCFEVCEESGFEEPPVFDPEDLRIPFRESGGDPGEGDAAFPGHGEQDRQGLPDGRDA